MKKKELLEALIHYYDEVLNAIKERDNNMLVQGYCLEKEVHFGICYCADKVFNSYIFGDDWIEKYKTNPGDDWFWNNDTAGAVGTVEEIIVGLQYRIDCMVKEYEL